MSVEDRKQLARNIARSTRQALATDDRLVMSKAICAHIAESSVWAQSIVVLTYFAAGSEVDLSELFRSSPSHHSTAGSKHRIATAKQAMEAIEHNDRLIQSRTSGALGPKTFGAPIVEGETIRFGHVRIGKDGSPQTIVGPYGLREPDGPPVTLDDVGLVLVPLLAFDSHGNRLGSGKGFYDRFLAKNPGLAERGAIMGVGFSAQEVDHLPVEPHDYRLHGVVTELGTTHLAQPTPQNS